MATATTKTKTQARHTKTAAKSTARTAKSTSKQAERTARALVSDGAYAAVGLGDTAVEILRTLPEQLTKLRTEGPKVVEGVELRLATPAELRSLVETARAEAATEFDALASRGRTVVTSISNAAATKRAFDQTRIAQTQLKGAITSVRRAVEQAADAVETAAGKVGR